MFNKKRIVVIVLFLILSFLLITYGASRGTKLDVTFMDGYDDSLIEKELINKGGSVKVPDEPYHENYVFGGWYLYDSIDTLIKDFTNIEENLKVEARYKADMNNNEIPDEDEVTFSVRFIDGVTGDILKSEEVLIYMNAIAPTPLSHANYTFVGWDKDYTNITSNIDVIANYNYNNPAPNITMYTLRFHDIDGEVFSTQSIQEGNASGYVAEPLYEGYTFKGWFLESNGKGETYILGSIVTGNLDIYSYYTLDKHEVIIDPEDGDLDGGDDPVEEEQIVDYGTKITLPNALKEYTLTYHANGENASILGNEKVSRNAILLGWCLEGTDCSTLINAGTEVIVKKDVKYKAVWGTANSAITLTNALRTMTDSTVYEFGGWSLTSDGTKEYAENYNLTLTSDLDLYAVWNGNVRKYDVVFNDEIDEENNPDELGEEQEIDYNTEIKLPGSKKSYTLTYDLNNGTSLKNGDLVNVLGVKFLGWCEGSKTCSSPLKTDIVLDNKEYNAVFEEKSEKIILTSAIRNADNYNTYEFLGWDEDKDTESPLYTKEKIDEVLELELTKDIVLYAVWKETPVDYTLTLNPNGGSISENNDIDRTYRYGIDTPQFPTPEKNYILTYNTNGGTEIAPTTKSVKFLGWCEGTSDKCDTFVTKTTMDSNKTYTAAWGTTEEITLPKAIKDLGNGVIYTFKEWYYGNPEIIKNETDKISLSSDLTVNVRYTSTASVIIDPNTNENTEGGIIDTPEGNPSDLENGENVILVGNKIKLPIVNNYYVLTYIKGTGSLLNGAKEVNNLLVSFKGWCDKASCTDAELLPALTEVEVKSEVTYKAVWGQTINEVVIADADKTDDREYDYTFEGWSLTDNGAVSSIYIPEATLKLDGNVTLYAIYSKVKQQYNISIIGNIDEENNPSNLVGGDNVLDHGTEFKLPNALLDYKLTYHVESPKESVNSGDLVITRSARFLGWCINNTTCTERIAKLSNQTVINDKVYNPIFGEAKEKIIIVGASKLEDNYNTYTFAGWATEANGTPLAKYNINNEITLENNLDLYAIFTEIAKSYTLTLNPNGGSISENDDINRTYGYGATSETFPIPTMEYTLTYDPNGGTLSTAQYNDTTSVEFLGWCEGTTSTCTEYATSAQMNGNKTYTAAWGNSEELSLISASKSNTERENFEFTGWFDGNIKYTDKIVLTKNTTLVANYASSVRYYMVCFDSTYDKNHLPEAQSKSYEELVTPVNNLNDSNHEFIGWITENGTSWNFLEDKVLNNLDLYAKWNNTLEFETNEGTIEGTTPNRMQEENADIILPGATKNYTLTYEENGGIEIENDTISAEFLGWCKDASACESPISKGTKQTITANTKYYAVWGNATDEIVLPNTTKTEDNYNTYEFAGWSTENNSTVNYTKDHELLISGDTTLYAVWTVVAKEYILTLNPNGGSINENDDIDKTYGYDEITETFPTPVKNYTLTYNTNGGTLDNENVDKVAAAKFLGWCEGTTSTCTEYVNSTQMNKNKTYTAAWGTSEEGLVLTGATKASTIDTNYTFKEWFYGTEEVKYNAGNTIYLIDNLTINARYDESIRNYTVIFDNNGYGTAPENQTADFGSKVTNPGELIQTGYTFDNWYKDSSLVTSWNFETDTVNENTISVDGNVYIYGKMNINNYNLTVSVTGGTASYNVNYTLSSGKYVVPFNSTIDIANITPQTGYYVKDIKLNNVSQTITSGTRTFEFKMPAENCNVEIILAKLTEEVLEMNSPIRSFYIETNWIDIRLKSAYMTCSGSRRIWDRNEKEYVTVPTSCAVKGFDPTIYYSATERDTEGYLLNSTISLGTKYDNPSKTWSSDASQNEIDNIKIDAGYHYHLDGINNLNNYKYFYVVYVENNIKYIIEYKRGTGVNYTIESFYSIKLS